MKTKLGIVGCGFLGNIVADAWKKGLLPDYELVGVTSRTRASAEKTAANVGCAVCEDMDALLALEPEYIVEAASVESVRAMAIPVLNRGVNLVILSIGAFADLDFYAQVKAAAVEGGAKVHLASGAIGGFDVLQTVTLMAQAQGLPETAGIETHTGAKGFRNTPVWAEHLLTDTEKTTVFTGNAKQAIATFPRRVNVAVATSLATTGPEITELTFDGNHVRIGCSPAQRIVVHGSPKLGKSFYNPDGSPITHAELDLPPIGEYVYFSVYTADGKAAHTRAFRRAEFAE